MKTISHLTQASRKSKFFLFVLMWVNSGELWNQNVLNRWSFWSWTAPVQLQALIAPDSWEFAAWLYSFVWEKCESKDSSLSPTTCWVTEHRYSHIHVFDCWLFMRCCRHLCLFSWVPCCVVLLLSASQQKNTLWPSDVCTAVFFTVLTV